MRKSVRSEEAKSKWRALCQIDPRKVTDASRAMDAARSASELGDMRLSGRWEKRAEQIAARLGGSSIAEVEFERAKIARRAGRILSCRHHVARALRADPSSLDLREMTADLMQRFGDLERAAACLASPLDVTANKPSTLSFLLRRAKLAADRGKIGEALVHARKVADDPRTSAAMLLSAGEVFLSASDNAMAETCFVRALGRDPNHAEAHIALAFSHLHRGRVHTAFAHAQRATDIAPNHPRTRLVGAVVQLLRNGSPRETLDDFDTAVEASPQDAETRALRARARRLAGDARGALQDLLVAKHSGTEAQNFIFDVAMIAIGRQFWGISSIEELTAMARNPEREARVVPVYRPLLQRIAAQKEKLLAKILWNLPESALTSFAKGSNDRHHYEEGELAAPKQLRLRLLASLCPDELLRVGHGNRSRHLTYVDPRTGRLLPLELRRSSRHLSKSVQWAILISTPDEVLSSFAAITREYPRSHHPNAYRGEVLLWLGRYSEAAIDFERGLEKNPNARWLHIGMGAVHLFQGDLKSAMVHFQRSIDVAPLFVGPTLHAYRGEVLRLDGKPEEARRDLQIACRDNPSRISAWVNLWLVEDDLGHESERDTALKEIVQRAPFLLSDAAEERFSRSIFEVESRSDRRVLLEYVLNMMRGNRSSSCITYFTKTDELRTVTM